MSTETVIDRAPERTKPPKMIHLARLDTPDTALCGKPLKGPWCGDDSVECVVCAELDPR